MAQMMTTQLANISVPTLFNDTTTAFLDNIQVIGNDLLSLNATNIGSVTRAWSGLFTSNLVGMLLIMLFFWVAIHTFFPIVVGIFIILRVISFIIQDLVCYLNSKFSQALVSPFRCQDIETTVTKEKSNGGKINTQQQCRNGDSCECELCPFHKSVTLTDSEDEESDLESDDTARHSCRCPDYSLDQEVGVPNGDDDRDYTYTDIISCSVQRDNGRHVPFERLKKQSTLKAIWGGMTAEQIRSSCDLEFRSTRGPGYQSVRANNGETRWFPPGSRNSRMRTIFQVINRNPGYRIDIVLLFNLSNEYVRFTSNVQ